MTERPLPGPGGRATFRGNLGSLVWPVPSPVTASRGGARLRRHRPAEGPLVAAALLEGRGPQASE
jgi:hypothetical protein